jgi:hypothetical protein
MMLFEHASEYARPVPTESPFSIRVIELKVLPVLTLSINCIATAKPLAPPPIMTTSTEDFIFGGPLEAVGDSVGRQCPFEMGVTDRSRFISFEAMISAALIVIQYLASVGKARRQNKELEVGVIQ